MEDKDVWYPVYERVSVIVFVENQKDREHYFKLFRLMLANDITKISSSKNYPYIESDKFFIRFLFKGEGARGYRAHYVLNLTQDKEFNDNIASPITNIYSYLEKDPNWFSLVK
jgi:hypothetical protein